MRGPSPGVPSHHHALQVPIEFEGIPVVDQEFVDDAHESGYAVHGWTINDCPTMKWLIALGVDGIMTDRPTLLEAMLAGEVTCEASMQAREASPPPPEDNAAIHATAGPAQPLI